jgi:hypothetical protein
MHRLSGYTHIHNIDSWIEYLCVEKEYPTSYRPLHTTVTTDIIRDGQLPNCLILKLPNSNMYHNANNCKTFIFDCD